MLHFPDDLVRRNTVVISDNPGLHHTAEAGCCNVQWLKNVYFYPSSINRLPILVYRIERKLDHAALCWW